MTTKFWTDGVPNSHRLRNINYVAPKMRELCNFMVNNDINCICKIYDFSPEKIINDSEHRPYGLGEYKKAEKTNLILKENSDFDYMFMFDSDEFFDEKDFTKIVDIFKNIKQGDIYTFDAAKLDSVSTLDIIENGYSSDKEYEYSFAYSGDKKNGPLGLGHGGGLGGVFICDIKLILELGGFDEKYVGWGGEDGDMMSRIIYSGKKYQHNPVRNFAPFHLDHFSDWGNPKYNKRFETES